MAVADTEQVLVARVECPLCDEQVVLVHLGRFAGLATQSGVRDAFQQIAGSGLFLQDGRVWT